MLVNFLLYSTKISIRASSIGNFAPKSSKDKMDMLGGDVESSSKGSKRRQWLVTRNCLIRRKYSLPPTISKVLGLQRASLAKLVDETLNATSRTKQ